MRKKVKKNKHLKLLDFHPMVDTLENIEIPVIDKDLCYESYYLKSNNVVGKYYYNNSDIIGEI